MQAKITCNRKVDESFALIEVGLLRVAEQHLREEASEAVVEEHLLHLQIPERWTTLFDTKEVRRDMKASKKSDTN